MDGLMEIGRGVKEGSSTLDEELDGVEGIDSKFRFAFLDIGLDEGDQFCRELLKAGDFAKSTLQVVQKSSAKKELHAKEVADILMADETGKAGEPLMIEFCRQSRQWVALMRISGKGTSKDHKLFSAHDFLSGIRTKGENGKSRRRNRWYGPWGEPDNTRHWLVRTVRVKHLVEAADGSGPVRYAVQCHIIAEVTKKYIALHWNGFNHRDQEGGEGGKRGHQFYYWDWIPMLLREVGEIYGRSLEWPQLNHLILHTLLESHDRKREFAWEHLRVRSMRAGVTLNARGTQAKRAGKHEVDIGGLKALSRALANSALNAAYEDVEIDDVDKADRAVLRTLIKEWGTRSYEFALDRKATTTTAAAKLFRAHCYFGVSAATDDGTEEDDEGDEKSKNGKHKNKDSGPDSFPHLLCYKPYGGSRTALDFVLSHLKW